MSDSGAEVWVTGIGASSPFGVGVEALWDGVLRGGVAIRPIELFDATRHRTQLAATAYPGARGRREGRTCALALDAAREAASNAPDLSDAGVFWGTSTGGMFEGEEFFWRELASSRGRTPVAGLAAQPLGAPACAVARHFGCGGPLETLASACSASTMAIEAALLALQSGEVEIALAGGSDGLCQLTYGGFNSLRAVADEPSRPFRTDREGLSIGEGAGALLLERADHARARGARPLAHVLGARSTCDAYHMTAPDPEGRGAAAALSAALEDAGRAPSEVAFINAHGTGTPHNDVAEWATLETVLGDAAGSTPVTATKGSVGHLLGACGGLEAVVCVRALQTRLVPPTPGAGPLDPDAPVDLVRDEPRKIADGVAVSLNLAFGGANSAIVLGPVEDQW